MRILVTGSKGMVGTALVNNLKNIRDSKNKNRPNIIIDEIFEYDESSSCEDLDQYSLPAILYLILQVLIGLKRKKTL